MKRSTVHITRSSDRQWNVNRCTRLELSSELVAFEYEMLGCVFEDGGKWRAYVPAWTEKSYEWHLLDGCKAHGDREMAVCDILDRKERYS